MPEAVVDRLETVDIGDDHGERPALTLGVADLAFGGVLETTAIVDAGEFVRGRLQTQIFGKVGGDEEDREEPHPDKRDRIEQHQDRAEQLRPGPMAGRSLAERDGGKGGIDDREQDQHQNDRALGRHGAAPSVRYIGGGEQHHHGTEA